MCIDEESAYELMLVGLGFRDNEHCYTSAEYPFNKNKYSTNVLVSQYLPQKYSHLHTFLITVVDPMAVVQIGCTLSLDSI